VKNNSNTTSKIIEIDRVSLDNSEQ